MSKTAFKSACHSIFQLIRAHQVRMSYEKRYGLTSRLRMMVRELHEEGYIIRDIRGIKSKHIDTLVARWQKSGLSVGTMKNRLVDWRFVCRIFRKNHCVKRNIDYGIGSRTPVATHNKAIVAPDFFGIRDPHLALSLELQRVFGLRREECLKIIPSMADKGNYLWLKASWTKGKVERCILIRTPEQRAALDRAKQFVGEGRSLIPSSKSYIQQRYVYDRQTRAIGYRNLHGLRHAYAQARYHDLTGREPPICGGKSFEQLTPAEQKNDRAARQIIANELGHCRSSIVRAYCG